MAILREGRTELLVSKGGSTSHQNGQEGEAGTGGAGHAEQACCWDTQKKNACGVAAAKQVSMRGSCWCAAGSRSDRVLCLGLSSYDDW